MTTEQNPLQELIESTARQLFDDGHSSVTPMLRGEPLLFMYVDQPELLIVMLATMFSDEAQDEDGNPPIDLTRALADPVFAAQAEAIIDAMYEMMCEGAASEGIPKPSREMASDELQKLGLAIGKKYSRLGMGLNVRLGQIETIEAAVTYKQRKMAEKLAVAFIEQRLEKDDLTDPRITPAFRDMIIAAVVAKGLSEDRAREGLAAVGLVL